MNGLSLLIALATVGVDVRWESGPNDQLVYTVRIESVVHKELLNGQAVVSKVEHEDRGIRRFRIAMGAKPRLEPPATVTASKVQYGWRPSVDDPRKIDYFVQVLPERLEALAQGLPIECEVLPEVPEVHYIYFFQGTAPLPQELPIGYQDPPPRGQSDAGVRPAANSVAQPSTQPAAQPRFSTPGLEGSRFAGDSKSAQGSVADGGRATTPRAYESDRGWRGGGASKSGGGQTYASEPGGGYREDQKSYGPDPYSRPGDEMMRVPESRQPYRYQNEPYRDQYESRLEAGRPPAATQPTYREPVPQAQPPANDESTKELVALIREQREMLQQQKNEALAKQIITPGYAAITPPGQAVAASANTTADDEGLRTPLVVTMLALFASLCANAYIGWLAWSFFWRFRNAASDLARAQTAATMRSAA